MCKNRASRIVRALWYCFWWKYSDACFQATQQRSHGHQIAIVVFTAFQPYQVEHERRCFGSGVILHNRLKLWRTRVLSFGLELAAEVELGQLNQLVGQLVQACKLGLRASRHTQVLLQTHIVLVRLRTTHKGRG
jgi:hypothetical protein